MCSASTLDDLSPFADGSTWVGRGACWSRIASRGQIARQEMHTIFFACGKVCAVTGSSKWARESMKPSRHAKCIEVRVLETQEEVELLPLLRQLPFRGCLGIQTPLHVGLAVQGDLCVLQFAPCTSVRKIGSCVMNYCKVQLLDFCSQGLRELRFTEN